MIIFRIPGRIRYLTKDHIYTHSMVHYDQDQAIEVVQNTKTLLKSIKRI